MPLPTYTTKSSKKIVITVPRILVRVNILADGRMKRILLKHGDSAFRQYFEILLALASSGGYEPRTFLEKQFNKNGLLDEFIDGDLLFVDTEGDVFCTYLLDDMCAYKSTKEGHKRRGANKNDGDGGGKKQIKKSKGKSFISDRQDDSDLPNI